MVYTVQTSGGSVEVSPEKQQTLSYSVYNMKAITSECESGVYSNCESLTIHCIVLWWLIMSSKFIYIKETVICYALYTVFAWIAISYYYYW